jgi:hypothetical protein
MATILSNVEDERCFSLLFVMKNELKNRLTIHVDLVMWMYAQFFYIMETFPLTTTIRSWNQ